MHASLCINRGVQCVLTTQAGASLGVRHAAWWGVGASQVVRGPPLSRNTRMFVAVKCNVMAGSTKVESIPNTSFSPK
jgi:hypothetical protein